MWKNASELRNIASEQQEKTLYAEALKCVENIYVNMEESAKAGLFSRHINFPTERLYYKMKEILEQKCAVHGYKLTYRLDTLSGTISWSE